MKRKKKKKIIIPKEGIVRNERILEGIYLIKVEGIGNYYGESNNIYRRWSTHRKLLIRGRHHCFKLQQAFKQLGPKAFSFKILEICLDKKIRLIKEQLLIKADVTSLNTKNNETNEIITNVKVPNKDIYKNKELFLKRIKSPYVEIYDSITKQLLGIEQALKGMRMGFFISDENCRIKRKNK